jgi:hypothetical protein
MNRRSLLQSLPTLVLLNVSGFAESQTTGKVYELRMYATYPGKLDALKARFRDHTISIFQRFNMKSVAYWTVIDPAPNAATLVYILEHSSREAAKANWAAFEADPEWQKVRTESEANGKIVSNVQSIFLESTDFSPAI